MIQVIHTLTAKSPHVEDFFTDYIAEENIFAVISFKLEAKENKGNQFLQELRDIAITAPLLNLRDLETRLGEIIKANNLPADFSLAIGYKKNDGIYLKTYGKAKIILCRGSQCQEIVKNEMNASGKIYEKDILTFLSDDMVDVQLLPKNSSNQIVEKINELIQDHPNQAKIALVCDFGSTESTILEKSEIIETDNNYLTMENEKNKPLNRIINEIKKIYFFSKTSVTDINKGKKITLIIVCILLVIFVWSVVLGYQRRGEANIAKKINFTKELVNQKLSQVDEVAFLNLPRAMVLINESKVEVAKLKKELGNKKEILALEEIIKTKENSIVKKEEKKYEEFFDLSVDNKKAKGDLMALDGDLSVIIDKTQGVAYLLSLTKKSLVKRTGTELKQAKYVAIYQNEVFVVTNTNGVIKITEDGKFNKIIEQDKEWGTIAGIWVYNGNVYLLDTGKDEIYKYLVAENGYSNKNSYIKSGNAVKLSLANSITIDSSVYIGLDNRILKYTAGISETFNTTYPEDNLVITKIFTTKDLEKVYVWDKNNTAVYILSKDGTYERETISSILRSTNDFVVYKNIAYLLKDSKVYSIDLR